MKSTTVKKILFVITAVAAAIAVIKRVLTCKTTKKTMEEVTPDTKLDE